MCFNHRNTEKKKKGKKNNSHHLQRLSICGAFPLLSNFILKTTNQDWSHAHL